ncbi:hypothetical protein CARUB_v10028630mg [Capsella rubella]|uniref:FKB95-like N-terminal Kelch domain-containing protein n=1 Tax=Capsella rubella TaxID=81985 RepID=R0GVN0_9BRAS|nr:F-box/kelch-repeat protein At4g39560 [Capsella rubella]EOA15233.1 hypothetical protein CARUB_v10028630mg [Capsella rubella]
MELYETRSLLGRTESVLYVCFQFCHGHNTRWFTLCRKPDQTLSKKRKKNKSSGYVLAAVPVPNSPLAHSTTFVVVGSNIYNIGGSIWNEPLSKVSILDCRSHRWLEGPSMRVERYWSAANVLDDKIYVAGGCDDNGPSKWMEVFDPKTQTWETMLNPLRERCDNLVSKSAVIDDEICMYGYRCVAYKPKEDRWKALDIGNLDRGWAESPYYVIDNILYCYSAIYGMRWYDYKVRNWQLLTLKGFKGGFRGLSRFTGYVHLGSYGGKMAVFWYSYMLSSEEKNIWCAVIALERRNNGQVLGKVETAVEWYDVVLTVPISYMKSCQLFLLLFDARRN